MTDLQRSISLSTARYKMVVVGDISVGKTSIITRFVENSFRDDYDPSIGIDFASKNIKFREISLKLQIWDTAGQEKYRSLIPAYVKGSHIILLVFDITSKFYIII